MGEALTRVQTVVAVGILHLRHRNKGEARQASSALHAYTHTDTHTYTLSAGTQDSPSQERLAAGAPFGRIPSAHPRPQPSSPVPSRKPHTRLSCLPTLAHTGGEMSSLQPQGLEERGSSGDCRESPVFQTPTCSSPTRPPRRRGSGSTGLALTQGSSGGARFRHVRPTEPNLPAAGPGPRRRGALT